VGCVLGVLAFSKNSGTLYSTSKTINPKESDTAKPVMPVSPHPDLAADLYQQAMTGFRRISEEDGLKKKLLTIVDFSKPSTEKRLFIIDVASEKILLHTYVAHGKNSGEIMANRFSNKDASYQSSLGFYLTGNTYSGSNGYSLRLKGLEPGFNDNAERRAVVMHGAAYVSEAVIRNTGRLGRSWGCPAVSLKEHKKIIDMIKEGSCLFIYAPEKKYLAGSSYLKDIEEFNNIL
jgi:hypothetical protein